MLIPSSVFSDFHIVSLLLEITLLPFLIICIVCISLEVLCWTITGERQAAKIRALYLKAILRQDIAFFDMEMSAGQAVERMAGDTFLIQDAIGEKVLCFAIVYYELQTGKLN